MFVLPFAREMSGSKEIEADFPTTPALRVSKAKQRVPSACVQFKPGSFCWAAHSSSESLDTKRQLRTASAREDEIAFARVVRGDSGRVQRPAQNVLLKWRQLPSQVLTSVSAECSHVPHHCSAMFSISLNDKSFLCL